MTVRRVEPGRRERLLEVATDLIAERGVARTSHRGIAERAGVPLGSMTYHFSGMEEILREVFTRFAEDASARFSAALAAASTREEACEAVVAIVHDDSLASPRGTVLVHELYALAARDSAYRVITTRWMARSRAALELHFDAETARHLDALIEGLGVHRALETPPAGREVTRDAVARITR